MELGQFVDFIQTKKGEDKFPILKDIRVNKMAYLFTLVRDYNNYLKNDLESVVCKIVGVKTTDIHSKLRNHKFVLARQIIIYIDHIYNKKTYESSAGRFGLTKSMTKHSIDTLNNLIETDPKIRALFNKILSEYTNDFNIKKFDI